LSLPLPAESNPENDTFRVPEGEIVPFRVAGFTTKVQTEPLKVALVSAGMPGAKAGLKIGDEIESIDGVPMHSLASLVLFLQHNGDKPATLGVMRDGKPVSLSIRAKKVANPQGKPTYKIGVAVAWPPSHLENLSLPAAFSKSVQENLKASTLVGDILQRLVSAQMSIRTLSGPVGIARMTGHVAALPGWTPMMAWTANISLQLGLLNLLPIPILDGGTILFLIIESIMRHDLNEQFKERVFQMAFVFLILITVIILFSDLAKIPAISRIKM
jgi:regulator of sigma E protease